MLATLIGLLGDFDVAEDAAQEAFAIAAQRWDRDGIPRNPSAWLITTARNRALDRLRRERTLAGKLQQLETPPPAAVDGNEGAIPDERLELIFTCCHPALAVEAQVALTLRSLGGLSTDEIARAFLVPGETMKRRLTRAKAKIKTAGIAFRLPAGHELPDRLHAVLAVVYLIFNQGYTDRADLADEAIRLGRLLAALMPDEPEVRGLLALMLLHHARRAARIVDDELVLLADQDRSLWDAAAIGAGRAHLDRGLARVGRGADRLPGPYAPAGPYLLQAAIASLQLADPPDWVQLEAMHRELARITGSPVVELNRAVALAETAGPQAALELVDTLDSAALDGYQYLHSTRAELLRRLGRPDAARAAYRRALALARAPVERRFLERRLAELPGARPASTRQ